MTGKNRPKISIPLAFQEVTVFIFYVISDWETFCCFRFPYNVILKLFIEFHKSPTDFEGICIRVFS